MKNGASTPPGEFPLSGYFYPASHSGANENASEHECTLQSRRMFVPLFIERRLLCALRESAARKSADRCEPLTAASAQRALAWLKQEREQVDPAQGKLTLAELCDRYGATIQHQKPKTIERKELIIRRIKKHWPTGQA